MSVKRQNYLLLVTGLDKIFEFTNDIATALATPSGDDPERWAHAKFKGIAVEAAAVGAVGATFLTIINKKFSMSILREVMLTAVRLTCMVFIILCGAAAFGLVFRGLDGDTLVREFLGGIAHKYSFYPVFCNGVLQRGQFFGRARLGGGVSHRDRHHRQRH